MVGPTATGKSDWGVALAQQFNGEVVSADSRQVYRGMDIGTGKIRSDEMGGVPHWMLDVAGPATVFTLADYQAMARPIVEAILGRTHIPIIVGGTGLYVRALLDGLQLPDAKPDPQVREMSLEQLQAHLRELDPDADVDWKNPRRLVRALEIVRATGRPLAESRRLEPPPWRRLVLGTAVPETIVEERITRRLRARLEQGMVDEVRGLLSSGVSHERLDALGLEYRFVSKHLQGELSLDELEVQLRRAIIQYARRQLTWFRKYGSVHWVESLDEARRLAGAFLSNA